jgi:FixJ family two-component response regulator
MSKTLVVSVVEDDRCFRRSMRRLMRSLAHIVEAFPSAADFLASPRLSETACLIAERCGRANPTILVTAYPNDPRSSHAR